MKSQVILVSIPLFFILMGIELLVASKKGKRVYRLNDTLSDLSCGIGEQLAGLFQQIVALVVYSLIYKNLRQGSILMGQWWQWLILLLAVDFLYYWYHRFSHRVNFYWAVHIVHHQSEEYNLAVALRQPWLAPLFSSVFYLPLVFIGFPPEATIAMIALDTVLQFWFHTRVIQRMGILEFFLNTPSHHRVHHGRNPKYLDKNYGAALIIWDRLFGTFQEEEEEPVYGIVNPLNSWCPFWSNIHYWAYLLDMSRKARGPFEKVRVWFASPERIGGPAPEVRVESVRKFDAAPRSRAAVWYASLQFALAILATPLILAEFPRWSLPQSAAAILLMYWTLFNVSGYFEQKRWVHVSEMSKYIVAAGFLLLKVSPGFL